MKFEFNNCIKDNNYIIAPIDLKDTLNSENCLYSLDNSTDFPIGTYIQDSTKKYFQIVDYKEVNVNNTYFSFPLALALEDISTSNGTSIDFEIEHKAFSLACITLSDKGFIGQREDESGKVISEVLNEYIKTSICSNFILPDNPHRLRALVLNLAHERQYDIIVTTGGTGIAPSDLTPEAILPLLTRRFSGFEQIMMASSFEKTKNALISRAFVGTIENTFIIALPGSPKAVKENLESIMPSLPHALDKLHGSKADCARL